MNVPSSDASRVETISCSSFSIVDSLWREGKRRRFSSLAREDESVFAKGFEASVADRGGPGGNVAGLEAVDHRILEVEIEAGAAADARRSDRVRAHQGDLGIGFEVEQVEVIGNAGIARQWVDDHRIRIDRRQQEALGGQAAVDRADPNDLARSS